MLVTEDVDTIMLLYLHITYGLWSVVLKIKIKSIILEIPTSKHIMALSL